MHRSRTDDNQTPHISLPHRPDNRRGALRRHPGIGIPERPDSRKHRIRTTYRRREHRRFDTEQIGHHRPHPEPRHLIGIPNHRRDIMPGPHRLPNHLSANPTAGPENNELHTVMTGTNPKV
ncbi:hypothetical protein JMUB6875_62650 [Nocardia sp. JMUB6875]